ncbi:MAG TPA: hypothetical protein VFX98_12505, partial [Longimicrobiaceae bacterium]|nr:hypothetical protein [Longimicrobiaceae bacterium]
EALHTVATLASGVGAPLRLVPLGGDGARLRERAAALRPPLAAPVEGVRDWGELDAVLRALGRDDLVVLLSARRGTAAWSPPLERLPAKLAAGGDSNLVVAYVAESGTGEPLDPDAPYDWLHPRV